MDAGVIRSNKAHYRKNLAKLRILPFEEKNSCKINILDLLKLLSQAWNSVSETKVRNCFRKVKFFHYKLEDDFEATESNVDGDSEGIWEKLQAGGLTLEIFNFSQYEENDSQLQTRETVTESSILHDLKPTGEDTTQREEEDNEDVSAEEVEPTTSSPTEASALMRQLDKYLRSHNDSNEMLRLLAKILQYVVNKSISKTKQLKISDFFARK